MNNHIEISQSWIKLVDTINKDKGIVMVLGASDTGKSTLVNYLAGKLHSKGNKVCTIDGDVGQSIIGPPTTIGLAFIKSESNDIRLMKPELMFFAGSTSPVGHLLPVIVGLKKLIEKSIQNDMDITIINTTGLVSGEVGWELKFQKINLINPRHIVAIQRLREIENILKPFESTPKLKIHRLVVNEKVKNKSQEQRRFYREQKFKEYFHSSKVKEIPLDSIIFLNPYHISLEYENNTETQDISGSSHEYKTGVDLERQNAELQDMIVGLNDDEGFTVGLGKVDKIDLKKRTVSLLTPVSDSDLTKVKTIRIGSTRLNLCK